MNPTYQNPPAIVVKVSLGESLPGIEALCKSLKGQISNAKKKSAQARLETLLIARAIFEYAVRADVIARVQSINVDPVTGKKKEGREKSAHRLAMEVVAPKCGMTNARPSPRRALV